MADYIPELFALLSILNEGKTYREALFKVNMEEQLSQIGKKQLAENVLGVLRHYFNLSFECLDLLEYNKDSEEHILSIIALYELRYHSDKDVDIITSSYKEAFLKERLLGDCDNNIKLLIQASQKPYKIKEEVKQAPYLFNSLVLEVPDFLLKRLSKDYTPKVALNIASYLHRKPMYFYAPVLEDDNSSLINDEDFENITFEDNSLLYRGKKHISLKECANKGIYPVGYCESLAFARLDIPSIKPKIMMANLSDSVDILPLSLHTLDRFESEVSAVFSNPLIYRNAVDVMKKYKLKNAKLLNCELPLVKTYRQFDSYDIVVCFGQDLKIGLAREIPSILPSLKEKDFLKSKNRQISDLSECAAFVKSGGQLLFINHALDKEESIEVISKFLSVHKNFTLVEKETIFPNRLDSDGGFYAILKRK